MNPAHLHLLLNHAPVLGTAFGLGLLLWGLWRTSDEVKKAALGVLVVAGLCAVPAYLTGEPAIRMLPEISKIHVERHEEAAEIAFTGIVILGIAALGGLILFRRGPLPNWFSLLMAGASLTVGVLMAWTANLGGEIRHSEIRSNNTGPAASDTGKNHE